MDNEPEDSVTVERQALLLAVGWMWASDRYASPGLREVAFYLARRSGATEFLADLEQQRRREQ